MTRSLVVVLITLTLAGPVFARGNPCAWSANCRDELLLSSGGTIPFYRSLPLIRNSSVERAVLVVHGNQRDADRYYDRAVAAARSEHRLDGLVLLAPSFHTLDDGPSAGEHYWSSQGWKIGNRSLDAKRISSFAVMDELLARVCSDQPAIFPHLHTVVIIGHSAGGQFVGRYAAGGKGCRNRAVEVRYVIMNPSSYLYVDARRKSATTGRFESADSGCRNYDDYKYGLRNLNTYMQVVGAETIRAHLFTRHTYYLAGDEDTRTGSSLDTRCEANLQGADRLARYVNYRDYSSLFDDWKGAVFITIPGIGHDGGKMLMSEIARGIMFR